MGFSQNPNTSDPASHPRLCNPQITLAKKKKNQKQDFTASRHEKYPVESVSVTCALTRWLPDAVQLTKREEGERPFPWIKSIALSYECLLRLEGRADVGTL